MAKITKGQATALAKKISREIQEALQPVNVAVRQAKDALVLSKLSGQLLEFYNDSNTAYKPYVSQFLEKKYPTEFSALPKVKMFSHYTEEGKIIDDIIVGTIEAENLTDLIASIKAKYLE